MPGTLIAEPLFAKPFLSLKERMMPGEPGTPLKVYPKLAATPKKLKAARSMTKLVMQTDIKIEELPAIGNPTENVPTDGLRLIHWNDRWILFGNTGTNPPRLYERTGPVYTRTEAYPNGDWPTNTSFTHAAFSKAGRFMYAVKANDTQNVQVYQWSGATEDSLDGEWELKTPLAIGSTVVKLEISPLNNFLIVRTGLNTTKLFDIQNLNAVVAPASLPVGNCLAVRPDELEWVFGITGSTVDVYSFDLGTRVFTLVNALPGSTGTDRKVQYSPDLLVLALNGKAASGTGMPKFYARKAGIWALITTGSHASATTWEVSDFAFKSDNSQAYYTHTSGGSKAEFLERVTVVPDPLVAGPATPFPSGAGSLGQWPCRSADGLRIALKGNTYSYDPGTETFTDTTPAGWGGSNKFDMSRDGLWLVEQQAGTISVWTWDGSAWVSATAPAGTTGTEWGISISRDGQFIALNFVLSSVGYCRIYQRNVGTGAWTQLGADIPLSNTDSSNLTNHTVTWHPTRDDILVFNGYGGIGSGVAPKFVRLISGTWTIISNPFPYQSGYNQMWGQAAWTSNGDFLLMMTRNNIGSGFLLHVFAFDDGANTFSLHETVAPSPAMTGTPVHLQLSTDEKLVAVVWNNANTTQNFRLFRNTGSDSVPNWEPYTIPADTVAMAATSSVVWTAGTLTLFPNSGTPLNHWLYSQFAEYPSYNVLYTFTAPSGASLPPNDGYNDSETIANFGGSSWAQHPYVNVSFTPSPSYPPSLGFAPQYAITAIWAYYLSSSKNVVLYQTVNGIGIATRPNTASSYLNTETLRACFVDLYDRVGNEFQLRSYSIHLIDTIVKDFQFSPNEEVLAYHTIAPVGAPGDTIQGRMVYDISLEKFDFRGNVWTADMTNSLMAFSPFSTEMVVTHERLVSGNPVITLHEFGVNYVFGTQDTKAVAFGPPDFSACNDVVVAHGGSPPMSFFVHDDPGNVLVPNPVVINWDYEGLILAIAFRDDCEGLVVVTPDTVTTIEEGEDEWTEEDEEDLDEPIEPPTLPEHEWPDVVWEPDDIEIIRDPLTNPNYPGTYDPNTLTNISYVPYTVVSVTFRVASVAQ
jgi:hypothetical protein